MSKSNDYGPNHSDPAIRSLFRNLPLLSEGFRRQFITELLYVAEEADSIFVDALPYEDRTAIRVEAHHLARLATALAESADGPAGDVFRCEY